MRRFPEPRVATPELHTPAQYLRWLARAYRRPLILAGALGIVQMAAQALYPAAIGRAIQIGIVAGDRGAVLIWSAAVLLLTAIQAIAGTLRDRAAFTSSLGAAYRTVQVITRHAAMLGANLRAKASAGDIVSISVGDVTHIRGALDSAVARGFGGIAAIFIIAILMLRAYWQLGLVVLVGVPLITFAITGLIDRLHARQLDALELQGQLTARAGDIARGLRVLRGIGGEELFARWYREDSERARGAAVRLAAAEARLDTAKVLLPGLLLAAIVWLGGKQVLDGRLRAGELVAFYGYAVFLASAVRWLTAGIAALARGYAAARRITRFLSLEPDHGARRAGDGDPLAAAAAALHDPRSGVRAEHGRLTAIVCAAEGEAEVLADRLGGYAPSDVTYGEVPLRGLPADAVRRHVLVADNQASLFAGTLGAELDPRDRAAAGGAAVQHAVDIAYARDIVEALPDGLATHLASPDQELSGGQRQRLRLARALLVDPDVLILVEPTNAVDANTEARIAERLRAEREGRTTIVFTSSPVLLAYADHVAYVEQLRVSASGRHAELVQVAGYRSIVTREAAP